MHSECHRCEGLRAVVTAVHGDVVAGRSRGNGEPRDEHGDPGGEGHVAAREVHDHAGGVSPVRCRGGRAQVVDLEDCFWQRETQGKRETKPKGLGNQNSNGEG